MTLTKRVFYTLKTLFFDPKMVTFWTPFLTPFWTPSFRSQSGHAQNGQSCTLEFTDPGIHAQDLPFSALKKHPFLVTFLVTFLGVFSRTETEMYTCVFISFQQSLKK